MIDTLRWAVVLMCVLGACRSEPERTAVVLEVTGQALQNGAPIARGSTLLLDEELVVVDGRVEIVLAGAGTLRVFASTRLQLPSKDSNVRLVAGRAWAIIDKLSRGHFEVETPTAIAGVRGTEFVVDAKEDESEVRVVEGEVEVTNKSDRSHKQSVKRGEKTRVRKTDKPSTPETYDAGDDQQTWQKQSTPTRGEEPRKKADPPPPPAKKPEPKKKGYWQRQGDAYKNMFK